MGRVRFGVSILALVEMERDTQQEAVAGSLQAGGRSHPAVCGESRQAGRRRAARLVGDTPARPFP